jgi:hypothetical protein
VSLVLSLAVILPALGLVAVFAPAMLSLKFAAILMLSGVAGAFLFNGAGLYTSVWAPRRVEFRRLFGNDMSIPGNLVMYAGLALSFGVPLWVSTILPLPTVLRDWPVFFVITAVCAAWYLHALRMTGRLVTAASSRLLSVLGI